MAWETALDRLLTRQIHLAEKGEMRTEEARQLVLDMHRMAPDRIETAFHLGYARSTLGVDGLRGAAVLRIRAPAWTRATR
jgi:hypothetical protein